MKSNWKNHTAYEHITQKREQILLIKTKTYKLLSQRSRPFGGKSNALQHMRVHQVPDFTGQMRTCLVMQHNNTLCEYIGAFLLIAVAIRSQKGSTTPLHVAGDARALEC
jgi:hypothetical protein